MIQVLAATAAFVVLGAVPGTAFAWGKTGHRVIGAIAERAMSEKARQGVKSILGTEGLPEASTWPDFMRSSPEPFWQKTAGPLHYVTVPAGKTYADVGAPSEGDAVTGLAMFAKVVRHRRAPLAERQRALRFIIHIVGDLHQPLHAGNGTDKGGNEVKVTWFGKPTNLHAVCDTDLVDDEQLSFTEYADRLYPRITHELARQWRDPNPLAWIAESAAIRETIYPTSPDLSFSYVFAQRATVEQRLEQGGVRLATYLDQLFQ